jgi:bifunctional non-homologous end joining protein LigD
MPAKTAMRSSLERYRAKRDFSRTDEPEGAIRNAATSDLRYLIQKHDATRLHYDFRLELDGTLKSSAVTKGPSLDPADKRLAVHVEDHPIEYGSFEGTIPEGQYGGGTVMLWDQGTWEPIGDSRTAYEKGRLTFVLHGKRLKGEWHLVRMGGRGNDKRDNWLLIKSNDEYVDKKNGDAALERYNTSATSGRSMTAIAKGNKQWKSKVVKTRKRAKLAKARKTVKKTAKKTAKKGQKRPSASPQRTPATRHRVLSSRSLQPWSASRPRATTGFMKSNSMVIVHFAASITAR